MGTLTDAKVVYGGSATAGGFSNEEVWVPVVYDFAADGGEVEDNIVLTAGSDMMIIDFYLKVATTVVGVGVDIALGNGAAGTELLSAQDGPTLVETAAANVFGPTAAFNSLFVGAAGTIQMGVSVAAITAGKFTMYFKIKKV